MKFASAPTHPHTKSVADDRGQVLRVTWVDEYTDPTDGQIVDAVRDGGRTERVADRLGMLNRRPYILRRLKRLETAGRVRRNSRYSFPHSFYWERSEAFDVQ